MKQILFLSLVVLVGATTLLLVSQKTSANAMMESESISGTCHYNSLQGEPINGLKVTVTGGGQVWYATTNGDGYYFVGADFENDVTYTIVAESPDFNANGGWRGTATVYVSCEIPPCSFGNQVRNIACTYYDNPN
jgi:hypothetical protein